MIPYFPDFYPDELLYSICARYSDRVHYPDSLRVVQELFGIRGGAATVDFPRRLDYLVSILPFGHSYTSAQLIDDHTLLPFYSPFLPLERVVLIRENMKAGNQAKVHQLLGLIRSSIRPPEWLRFCPLCVQNDKEQFGETYWHRLHQLPGVEVCPNHCVFLETSSVSVKTHSYNFVSTEQVIQPISPRSLNLSNVSHKILLKIALDAAWLLRQRELVSDFKALQSRYLDLLANQQLASFSGTIQSKKLQNAFNNYYPNSLLKRMQCEVNEQHDANWLAELVQDLGGNRVHHPLRHLLLSQFLECQTEDFFKLPITPKPFGKGPWPCLNRASAHFHQLTIEKFQLAYHRRQKERPVGIFSCSCGFTYSRNGPELSKEDRFRITKVRSYGSVWEARLRILWEASFLSIRELARQLGVDPMTIQYHAIRLGLASPHQWSNKKLRYLSEQSLIQAKNTQFSVAANLENYREKWLSLRREHPEAGRTELMKRFPGVQSWLRKHDSEWLKAHSPPSRMSEKIKSQLDWQSRDAPTAAAVRLSVLRIQSAPGRLVRITKTSIAKDLAQKALIMKQLSKLPLTAQVLVEVVESTEEFAIRRIKWATEHFRQENIYPAQWELVNFSGVYRYMVLPQVKEAINIALQSLNPTNIVNSLETLSSD